MLTEPVSKYLYSLVVGYYSHTCGMNWSSCCTQWRWFKKNSVTAYCHTECL